MNLLLLFLTGINILNYKDIKNGVMEISEYSGEICLSHDTLFEVDFINKKINLYRIKNKDKIGEIKFGFKNIYGICKVRNILYLLDFKDHLIYVYNLKTKKVENEIYLSSPSPSGVYVKDRFIFFSDLRESKVYKIFDDGTVFETYELSGVSPISICVYKNYIIACDRRREEIYMYDAEHRDILNIIKSPGPYPSGVFIRNDSLFVSDFEKDSLYIIKLPKENSIIRYSSIREKVKFLYRIENKGKGNVYGIRIYFAIPRSLPSQKIENIRFYPENPLIKKDFYNEKIAIFKKDLLKPFESAIFEMGVKCEIYEVSYYIIPEKIKSLKEIPASIKRKYLKDSPKFLINHPFIRSSVKKAVQGEKNPYWIARKIFNYIIENMEYELKGGWDIAPEVLKRGKGSCSEYSYVMISMLRSAGIPAMYEGATTMGGDRASIDNVFHRWVKAYIPGVGWIPIDPAGGDSPYKIRRAKAFGYLPRRYLITTHGGGESEYMGWSYNFNEEIFETDFETEVDIDRLAIWEPAEE